MKITHIFHSGFLVKIENKILIFDCLDSDISRHFKDEDDIYVFASHGHSDHYSSSIFDWQSINPDIKYFLGYDIKIDYRKSNYYTLNEYQSIKTDDLTIKSFGSTDRGVSFLVNVNGVSIFHAGDLNWWHWKNDSPQTQKNEERDFKLEVEKLRGENIDIAFIPVDPRLEEYFYLSAEYFVKTIQPKILIPMHFGENFDITYKIKDKLSNYDVKVIEIERKNQEFNIKL